MLRRLESVEYNVIYIYTYIHVRYNINTNEEMERVGESVHRNNHVDSLQVVILINIKHFFLFVPCFARDRILRSALNDYPCAHSV